MIVILVLIVVVTTARVGQRALQFGAIDRQRRLREIQRAAADVFAANASWLGARPPSPIESEQAASDIAVTTPPPMMPSRTVHRVSERWCMCFVLHRKKYRRAIRALAR